jgi:hypothetical protein
LSIFKVTKISWISTVLMLCYTSHNESGKKPGFRVAAWFLVFLSSFYVAGFKRLPLWQAAQRIVALST